jgi:hypothetical protein
VRHAKLAILLVACATAARLGAQTPAPPTRIGTADPNAKPALTTFTDCVSRGEGNGEFTRSDVVNRTFQLKGNELKSYVGQPIEMTGNSRRVHVVGGLWPPPNVAAQAGAIDPVQAAQAALPGGAAHGTGPEAVREFDVKKMPVIQGSCP